MTGFHALAIPHDDILQGRLTMVVFAADCLNVCRFQLSMYDIVNP